MYERERRSTKHAETWAQRCVQRTNAPVADARVGEVEAFRRHVGDGACLDGVGGEHGLDLGAGQAKVCDLGTALGCEQDVAGFQVSVAEG